MIMYCFDDFDDGGGDSDYSDCGGGSGAVGYQTIMMSWIASGHTMSQNWMKVRRQNPWFPWKKIPQPTDILMSTLLADWNPEFVN